MVKWWNPSYFKVIEILLYACILYDGRFSLKGICLNLGGLLFSVKSLDIKIRTTLVEIQNLHTSLSPWIRYSFSLQYVLRYLSTKSVNKSNYSLSKKNNTKTIFKNNITYRLWKIMNYLYIMLEEIS